ncbi:MAG: aminopeptidase [Flavobacteriaceae bacterium]|nr:aminopeptidase [Flavobacteriaceae bacterium]
MTRLGYICIWIFCCVGICNAQMNQTKIKANLDPTKDLLYIQQETKFVNTSDSVLNQIYFHNWTNSFKNNKTPLAKRLVEDFKKQLYFAKDEDRGFTSFKNLTVNYEAVDFYEKEGQVDILEVQLKKGLQPKDSLLINVTYTVKIQNSKFTAYGKTDSGYHLRYWYLAPAVFDTEWQLMSNLNLNDLYETPTDFTIELGIPNNYFLESNLYQYESEKEGQKNYVIVGKEKTDVILSINQTKKFKTFKTNQLNIYSDVSHENITTEDCESILERHVSFIQKYLGNYPYKELYIDEATQGKNPVYGLNQLPSFLSPFEDRFNWDLNMFKAISYQFLKNTFLLNTRDDHWFLDGLQNYLMLEYVERFYPDKKLLGKVSDYWLVRTYNLAKAKFNDKYHLAHQFISTRFLDQALKTPVDSLSNFNMKIANKYKSGLGFRYLKAYVGDSVFDESIQEYYFKNKLSLTDSKEFENIIRSKTEKDLDWFFNDFIQTNKKIDYTIKAVKEENDSISVLIKNKRNFTAPVLLYSLNDRNIISKKWVTDIKDTATVTLPKGTSNKVALNYENLYPELNTSDNWKSLEKKIFNKPLKFTLMKDIEDPYYNQIYYQPEVSFNLYNGLILSTKFHNRPIIRKNFEFTVAPAYATKSKNIIGSFAFIYNQFFEKTNIYRLRYGVTGLTFDYAPNLSYRSLIPFVNMEFKRKSLRSATYENLVARVVNIDKDVLAGNVRSDEDTYSVFSLNYNYIDPNIIDEVRYNFSFEYAGNFSKLAADIRYRALTKTDTQLDFRLFAGTFLNNRTTGDYFSFGLDFSNDYLFQLDYFGRSEDTGIFSQQFIIAEGGFKSVLPTRFANQYMIAFNSSIGLWKWVEFYNDVAFLKNRNNPVFFGYNNGIRLNFVHNILELYFPLYSNNGWEIAQPGYGERIRFTFTTQFEAIFNFIRRGVF